MASITTTINYSTVSNYSMKKPSPLTIIEQFLFDLQKKEKNTFVHRMGFDPSNEPTQYNELRKHWRQLLELDGFRDIEDGPYTTNHKHGISQKVSEKLKKMPTNYHVSGARYFDPYSPVSDQLRDEPTQSKPNPNQLSIKIVRKK